MILIVKTEKLFMSYTRFFLDILIPEDGAYKVSVTNCPFIVHNIPLDQRIHKLVRIIKKKIIPLIN